MDYLDLRDLADEMDDLKERIDELDTDEKDRLKALTELESDLGYDSLRECADNEPTMIMIPESEWQEYAEQLADDVGMVDADSPMRNYIDWEKWAQDLAYDYGLVTFDGADYYVRSW